jgi:hypothetical protein
LTSLKQGTLTSLKQGTLTSILKKRHLSFQLLNHVELWEFLGLHQLSKVIKKFAILAQIVVSDESFLEGSFESYRACREKQNRTLDYHEALCSLRYFSIG